MSLTKILSLGIFFLVSLGLLGAQESKASLFAIKGKKLNDTELAKVEGGETYISYVKDKKILTATTVPIDKNGSVDYSNIKTVTTAAGSNPVKNLVYDKANNDYYKPTAFPDGTWKGKVTKISDPAQAKKYGDEDGNWLTTDASTMVESYKKKPDGSMVSNTPPTRKDWGYNNHGNSNFTEATSYEAPSYGCGVISKSSATQINRNIQADNGRAKISVR